MGYALVFLGVGVLGFCVLLRNVVVRLRFDCYCVWVCREFCGLWLVVLGFGLRFWV